MKPNNQPANANELFMPFAKQSETDFIRTGNHCVIYTRVSSKEQMENNSLETQLRECSEYAIKNKLSVVSTFGGTYESAKSDERKEFKRMFAHVKKNRNIAYLIIYSLDRFSRTGNNALDLCDQLRKFGVRIIAITQPIDASNASGMMMQDIMLLFAKHDNDQRKTKTIAGTRERILRGEWCNGVPLGYKYQREENAQSKIVLDETYASLIVKAFELKAHDKLSDVEIRERLMALGWEKYLTAKRLGQIFRNPFYCGKISSTIIPDQIIQGKHPAIISEELFLLVHGIKSKIPQGYKHRTDENIPFGSLIKCALCGEHFVGYKKDKQTKEGMKSYYYYKCRKIGCKNNLNAKNLREEFSGWINVFTFDEQLVEPLRYAMNAEIEILTKIDKDELKALREHLSEVEKELKTIRQRWALGKIDETVYNDIEPEYKEKAASIQHQIEIAATDYSNFSKYVDNYIDLALNLPSLWALANCHDKEKLQKFVFPDGIYYDGKKREFRTKSVNEVFGFIAGFSGTCEENESGFLLLNSEKSASVPSAGVEPACQ
ncbi:recombinase family protein [soil metagenome]